jgi:23S rRNA pseudouridine1911/1915/1917 synthase
VTASHVISLTAAAEEAGERLDRVLAARADGLSRARVKALIEAGAARIDGRPVTDANHRVKAGTIVTLDVPPPEAAEPAPQDLPLTILYEDRDLIVIDKPAGLVVHPAAGHADGTLVNALIAHCGDSLSGIGGVRRPGIVHRLDKDTSGVMVVAKNDRAHQALAAQFADHGRSGPLEREYVAVCWGQPLAGHFTIDAPLDRHPVNREKIAVRATGREAITHVEVLERFAGPDGQPVAALIACRLETGRTHQIRVHLSHRGHPLMGDETYATGFRTRAARLSPDAREALAALGRQALHARLLGLAHPRTGETMVFETDMPADMARLVYALRAM